MQPVIYIETEDEKKFNEFADEFGEEDAVDQLMRWKCLTDLYYLTSEVLGLGRAKREKDPLLDPVFHKMVCGWLANDEDCLVKLARGHLKTALLCAKVVQDILIDPNVRVHIYSITQEFVETTHLAMVKQHLETPLLNRLFPDVVPPRAEWESDVKNRLTMRRDKSTTGQIVVGDQIQVYGVGNTITGKRCTRQYFDDLIDKDTVRTQTQMHKTREWFSGAMPIMEPGGIRKMIGTPYHYADLYHIIEEEEIFDKVYSVPIKLGKKYACRWWNEKRERQFCKGMLTYDIKSQLYLDPMPIEDMAFPPPQPTYRDLPEDEYTWYMAVDPAATTEKYSDDTAIIVAAVNATGNVYITEEHHGKWPGNETAKKIIELTARVKPRKVGIEFGLQEHLRYIVDSEKSNWEEVNKRTLPIYIEPIRITNRMNKFDRVNWTLGSFVKEGKVKIHEHCVDLIGQMNRFNKNYNGKDDLVDAASMIFQLVDIFSYRNYTQEIPQWEPRAYYTMEEIMDKDKPKGRERFIS